MTKEEMISQLIHELEQTNSLLDSKDIKTALEKHKKYILARLEAFGVNTEEIK